MSAELNHAAQCYCLFVGESPAVIGAMLYRPSAQSNNVWGLSRIVTLPDYQGLGLAFVLMDTLGAAFAALGQRMRTYPAHPALIHAFDKSEKWALKKQPGFSGNASKQKLSGAAGFRFGGRPNATFEWVGAPMENREQARDLLSIKSLS
jgi:GNAT superfamily N-acetyltransferase